MTTYLGKSCSFCLPRVPFVSCCQFMYLVISLLVLRARYRIWLYQFLIIAYLFTFQRHFFETCNKWMKWLDISVDIKNLSTGGCLPLPWGFIHVKNHEKKCIKPDFKEIFLKLATNDRSDKMFLLTSKFCPQGVVGPCPGAIYMYKS